MTCEPTHAERTERLQREYGRPRHVDDAAALRMLGFRDQVHPSDVMSFAYPSWEAAEAYAASNLKHYGHPTLGTSVAGDAVVSVLDLRPALSGHAAWSPADPSLPDDWTPHRKREAS